MSLAIHTCPLAGDGLHLVHQTTCAVYKPAPDDERPSLIELARLAKAKALTHLLQTDDVPAVSLPNAAWAIGDIVGDARALCSPMGAHLVPDPTWPRLGPDIHWEDFGEQEHVVLIKGGKALTPHISLQSLARVPRLLPRGAAGPGAVGSFPPNLPHASRRSGFFTFS